MGLVVVVVISACVRRKSEIKIELRDKYTTFLILPTTTRHHQHHSLIQYHEAPQNASNTIIPPLDLTRRPYSCVDHTPPLQQPLLPVCLHEELVVLKEPSSSQQCPAASGVHSLPSSNLQLVQNLHEVPEAHSHSSSPWTNPLPHL